MPVDHDSHMCARLGHYIGTVTVTWCPHLQAYGLYVRVGDDRDDTSWRFTSVEFGPFDGPSEVERRALSELQRVLRADRAGWAGSGGQAAPGAPTTGG